MTKVLSGFEFAGALNSKLWKNKTGKTLREVEAEVHDWNKKHPKQAGDKPQQAYGANIDVESGDEINQTDIDIIVYNPSGYIEIRTKVKFVRRKR